jgi:hypothetical protein
MRFGEKLRPLVTGLAQFASAADIAIQAGPSAAIVLYSGARLIIQVCCFIPIQMTPGYRKLTLAIVSPKFLQMFRQGARHLG